MRTWPIFFVIPTFDSVGESFAVVFGKEITDIYVVFKLFAKDSFWVFLDLIICINGVLISFAGIFF